MFFFMCQASPPSLLSSFYPLRIFQGASMRVEIAPPHLSLSPAPIIFLGRVEGSFSSTGSSDTMKEKKLRRSCTRRRWPPTTTFYTTIFFCWGTFHSRGSSIKPFWNAKIELMGSKMYRLRKKKSGKNIMFDLIQFPQPPPSPSL